ncbi:MULTISPECIES: SCO7460 family lipoprotein [unclassified Streptomyces]|uniref:SCO7460 family lipoprotein n=1 Tax=unclassified Streptomyces TaxID=2593676 RepID=UPI003700B862
MARSLRDAARRLAGVLALVLAGAGLTGCGTFSTGDDRKRAEEIAERVAPGALEVVGVRNLFPQTGGAEVSFRIKGDADAVVRLRVDAGKDDCEGRSCDERLTAAIARARLAAGDFRVLRREFGACGYEVHALSADGTGPWISAPLGADTVRPLVASVGECLDRLARARGGPAPAYLSVKVAPPDRVADLPGDPGQPSLMRLTGGERLGALAGGTYHRVGFRAGPDGRVDRATGEVDLVQPFSERQRFGDAVRASAEEWLRTEADPPLPRAVAAEYTGVWKLLPGRVDRVGGWVLYCERPEGQRPVCLGRHALAVTAGLDGSLTAEPRVFHGVREGDGPLGLPTEEDGAPSYAWPPS